MNNGRLNTKCGGVKKKRRKFDLFVCQNIKLSSAIREVWFRQYYHKLIISKSLLQNLFQQFVCNGGVSAENIISSTCHAT